MSPNRNGSVRDADVPGRSAVKGEETELERPVGAEKGGVIPNQDRLEWPLLMSFTLGFRLGGEEGCEIELGKSEEAEKSWEDDGLQVGRGHCQPPPPPLPRTADLGKMRIHLRS